MRTNDDSTPRAARGMHAGTPSADGAHIFLCVALSLVMCARTFVRALDLDARLGAKETKIGKACVGFATLYVYVVTYVALRASNALLTAPGSSFHFVCVLVPFELMLVAASAANGTLRGGEGKACALSIAASATSAALPRGTLSRLTNSLALVIGFAHARFGGELIGFALSACAYAGGRLATRAGEDIYFSSWAGTIAVEIISLCLVKFALPSLGTNESAARVAARRKLAASKKLA